MENVYTPEQVIKIRQKESTLPDALKRDPSVNYTEGWFFVTLNTRNEVPILSTCEGSPDIPDGEPGAPYCDYTELGKCVLDAWKRNEEIYDHVMVDIAEAMPEHFHGLIYLQPGNKRHLGQIIKGFMIGCSHAYWDILGIPWREMTYTKGVRTPQYNDKDHTKSFRGPALFVRGYNDMEPVTPEEVEIKRAYIRDQARRRLLKSSHPSAFAISRNHHSHNWHLAAVLRGLQRDSWFFSHPAELEQKYQNVQARLNMTEERILNLDYLGNRSILFQPRKVSLICHRADIDRFEQQAEAVMQAARGGAVVVSAFISERERAIRDRLVSEQLTVIELTDNGFSDRYKPAGRSFYACAEGWLLQLSCWTYVYTKETKISREACLTMNEFARIISNVPDDWWKG